MSASRSGAGLDRRVSALAFCLTFCFAVIIGQLVHYQVLVHDALAQAASEQRTWNEEVPSDRGYIADTNGHILALQAVEWQIEASPDLVTNPEELAGRLAELLVRPQEEIYAKLTSGSVWVRLAMNVDYEAGEAIKALNASGIKCVPEYHRSYPEKDLTAHVLGIVNRTGDGFYGVEGYHNQSLRGISGQRSVEKSPVGEDLPLPPLAEERARPGDSLVLTLDRNIQYIVAEELHRALEEFGAQSGTVLVMDPRTGALLASYSYPSYSPNDFAQADLKLLSDPAVSKMWEPGSIFKVVTWAAGIDSGTISPGTTFYDNGALEVGGRVIQNWDRQANGLVTMRDGLVGSLNTVAAFTSTSMGKDVFYNYVRRFGFGTLTQIDLASEGPGMVKLPGDSNWFPSDLGTNSFGQGIAVTPIQMLAAVSSVANRGVLMKPYVVQEYITHDGEGVRRIAVEPMAVRRAVSAETAETMVEMLVAVVNEGAPKAAVPGYRVAGKSGTAQIPEPYGYHPTDTIAAFVGFAPADDPRFALLVKLDKPTASPWGTQTAAQVFQAIAQRLLIYMRVPPDDLRVTLDQ
jgi:cell division protein FtsI/penicillin-binding protein 2